MAAQLCVTCFSVFNVIHRLFAREMHVCDVAAYLGIIVKSDETEERSVYASQRAVCLFRLAGLRFPYLVGMTK